MPAIGHVHPTLPLVRALVDRGERVIYYCGASLQDPIAATGAEFRPVPCDFSMLERGDVHVCDMALLQLRCAASWLPALQAEVAAERPAYLLVDFMCLWGRFVAQHLGLPTVTAVSTFAIYPGMVPPRWLFTALDAGPSPARLRTLWAFQALGARLARTYGVERVRLPVDVVSMDGDMILVFTSRLFQPRPELFDERCRFIGPCIDERPGEDVDALPALDERPLVYVSLGTVFNRRPAFFRACIEAFRGAPFQVLMSVGKGTDPALLGPLPENVHVRRYVPQIQVLRRAAVFISHGGMNSTSEAMLHEVPMIVFPQGADQFAVARRLEELGVGVQLRRHQRRPGALRAITARVIADRRMRAHCRRVHDSFLQAGGVQRGVDELMAFRDRYARLAG